MPEPESKVTDVLKLADTFGLALKCGFLYNIVLADGTKAGTVIQKCAEKGIDSVDIMMSTGTIQYKDGSHERFSLPEEYSSALNSAFRIIFWLVLKGYDPERCVFFKYGDDRVVDDPLHESVLFYLVYDKQIAMESISFSFISYKEESVVNNIFFCKDGSDEIWISSRNHERSLKTFWDTEFEKTITSRQYRIAMGTTSDSKEEIETIKFNRMISSLREAKYLLVILIIIQAIVLVKHLF